MDRDSGPNRQLEHDAPRTRQIFPVCLVADDLELAANVGSLFRVADALGVEKLFLTGRTPRPPDRKLGKAARTTERHVAYEHRPNAIEVVQQLAAAGYTIVSLELSSRSRDIRSFDRAGFAKLALIVGSETAGVRAELLDASTHTVHIPMFGHNSSMNVATACAIALFELTQRFMPRP